jgi:hypothetical protein
VPDPPAAAKPKLSNPMVTPPRPQIAGKLRPRRDAEQTPDAPRYQLVEAPNSRSAYAMTTTELLISDGPDKAELLRSLASHRREISTRFCTSDGAFDVIVDQMDPSSANRKRLILEGHFCSGIYSGLCFAGTYDLDTKRGLLMMHIPADAAPAL